MGDLAASDDKIQKNLSQGQVFASLMVRLMRIGLTIRSFENRCSPAGKEAQKGPRNFMAVQGQDFRPDSDNRVRPESRTCTQHIKLLAG